MILFLEWLEAGRTVRGTIYRGGPAPENFRMTSNRYLLFELCVSDNLEDSRGADEESELSSVLIHPTPRRRHCQPQAPFKKPTDCLDGRSINKRHPTSMTEQRSNRLGPQLTKSWPSTIVAGNRD